MIKVKKLTEDAQLPVRAHSTDAGMDLFANEDVVIPPNGRKLIGTGIAIAIPESIDDDIRFYGQIAPRSGLANKHGLHTLGGVIDSSYRGEIKVILQNLCTKAYEIQKGDKIAQLIILPIVTPGLQEVEQLEETTRGEGGFGSTGQ